MMIPKLAVAYINITRVSLDIIIKSKAKLKAFIRSGTKIPRQLSPKSLLRRNVPTKHI